MSSSAHIHHLQAALDWQHAEGITELTVDQPIDRFKEQPLRSRRASSQASRQSSSAQRSSRTEQTLTDSNPTPARASTGSAASTHTATPEDARQAAQACNTLEELSAAVTAFDGCPLKQVARNTVFAAGNPAARVMIVGEAPGEQEDIEGLPFVGRSGQLLDKALSFVGLDRTATDPAQSVYITNIMPWRPPGNRNPLEEEIRLLLPFCEQHIQLAKPEVLLLLGNIANKSLLRTTEGITKLRGRWARWLPTTGGDAIPALPSYHPSYLLRTPSAKRAFWQDLMSLRKRLYGTAAES